MGAARKETKAMSDMEARKEARSAPGDLMRGPPPPGFSIVIPKVTRAKTTSELGRESPTSAQPAPGCVITSELYGILEAQEIEEDEASNMNCLE